MLQVNGESILGVKSSDLAPSWGFAQEEKKDQKESNSENKQEEDLVNLVYGEITSVKSLVAVIPKEVN